MLALCGLLALLAACAQSVPPRRLPQPLEIPSLAQTLERLHAQSTGVVSFLGTGNLTFKEGKQETPAQALIVGTSNPLRLKLEATHPWGRPLLHLLVRDGQLHALYFPEKRLYRISLQENKIAEILPLSVDLRGLWSLLRGYPDIPQHAGARREGEEILFQHSDGEVFLRMQLDPRSGHPRRLMFNRRAAEIEYRRYASRGKLWYAREVDFRDAERETSLQLRFAEMNFNRPLPEEIFKLLVPPGFSAVN